MPAYEYYCKKCDLLLTVYKKFSEMNKKEYCTNCKKIVVRKEISASDFYLKGTGYHYTDYNKAGCKRDCYE